MAERGESVSFISWAEPRRKACGLYLLACGTDNFVREALIRRLKLRRLTRVNSGAPGGKLACKAGHKECAWQARRALSDANPQNQGRFSITPLVWFLRQGNLGSMNSRPPQEGAPMRDFSLSLEFQQPIIPKGTSHLEYFRRYSKSEQEREQAFLRKPRLYRF